jgi:carbamate kinase
VTQSALIAIGGNSLIRAGERGCVQEQINNARIIGKAIAVLVKAGLQVVITHGNGPQVGAALLRSERAAGQVYELGLDVCVAATQGEIGYLLQQAVEHEILLAGVSMPVSTVLTQVVVAQEDPAFGHPTKPIGPFYSRAAAEEKARLYQWNLVEDAYRGYRRTVASPEPLEIVEEEVIRRMLRAGILVIALGGGGVPVIREYGVLRGVDAVVDKDHASALLAQRLSMDTLAFSTDTDYVYLDFKQPGQRPLREISMREAKMYFDAGHFAPGSMGPKISAALGFLRAGGREAVITSHDHLDQALLGTGGTRIVADNFERRTA